MPNDGPIRSLKRLRQMCQSHPVSPYRGWNRWDRIQLSGNLDTARSGLQVKLVELFQMSRRPRIFKRFQKDFAFAKKFFSTNRIKYIQGVRQRSAQELCHLQLPSTTSTELCRCFAPFVPGISIGPFCQQELRRAGIAVVSTKCQGGDEPLLAGHVGIWTRF